MRSRVLYIILLMFITVSLIKPTLAAVESKSVLILDIPRLALDELNEKYPNFFKLVNNSTVGLMTTPLPEPVAFDQVYLGFNSGTQLKSVSDNYLLFNFNEDYKGVPAGKLYYSLMGIKAPSEGIVHLGFNKITQITNKNNSANIGLFGSILHQNELKTGVIGNADADLINRCGALMLMDQTGKIDHGSVGVETLLADSTFPFGFRTDPNRVLNEWREINKKAQVIVVTLGDLERLERFNFYLTEKQWFHYRRQILANYDRLLRGFLTEVDPNRTLLMVFTALPSSRKAMLGERLVPVMLQGPGFHSGLAFSGSTRQSGIVTYYDLPTTILEFLAIKDYHSFNGRVLNQISGDWELLLKERPRLVKNYNVRWPLLTVYGYLLIAAVLLGIIGLIFWPKRDCFFKWLGHGYLFLLTIPAVFLIEAIINPLDWITIIGWTIGLGGLIWSIAYYFSRGAHLLILAIISWLTVGLIILEGFFNGILESKSFLGYSAIAGARFYGIGNEYLGFLLGAYIVAVSISLVNFPKYRSQILWPAVFLLAVFLAHPNLGSNIGGGVTALLGLGITTCLWLKRPVRVKEIVGLVVALILLLIIVGFWDLYVNNSSMTHFGQLISLIRDQGPEALTNLFSRKWELNLRLIAYTQWAKVLLIILVAIPFIYRRPPSMIVPFLSKYPIETRGFLGISYTSLIALFANDSGIVTLSTMNVFGVLMLLMLTFKLSADKRSDD